jgi:flagellar biosynthesis/type III secretory pathway protein FliH
MEGINLSERLLYRGRALENSSFAIEDFNSTNFGPEVKEEPAQDMAPLIPAFEEFERPAQPKGDTWVPGAGLPGLVRSDGVEAAEPSLGYLFKPFDPGKTDDRVFEEQFKDLPKPENYEYVQMDTRDTGIVATLEMANKKAAEIVASAFEQGRRLEENMLKVARADAEIIEKEAQEKAEAAAAEILDQAAKDAEAVLYEAKAKVVESEAIKAETEKLKAEAAELKAQADSILTGVVAREESLAPREAEIENIKAEIEKQRQEILAQATKEAQEAKEKATVQGLAEGRNEGRAQGQKEAKNEILSKSVGFFKIMDRINGLWDELWRQKAPFMVTLAVDAAEAIVNKEIKEGQGLATGAFAACIDYLKKCHSAVFRVNPDDLAEIEAARASLRNKVDGKVNIVFKPDPSLGPGDIIMESDAGLLDATLKNRRERVMAVLRQALEDGLVAELPPDDPQVVSQGALESAPQAAPQGALEVDSQAATEANAQAGPEVDSQAATEANAQAGPEANSQAATEANAQAGPEVDSQAATEANAQAGPEVDSQAAPELNAQAGPEVDSQAATELNAQAGSEVNSKTPLQPEPEALVPGGEYQTLTDQPGTPSEPSGQGENPAQNLSQNPEPGAVS